MTTEPCVDEDELVSFAEQKLSPEKAKRVTSHVSECSDCRQVLADIGRDLHTPGHGGALAPLKQGMTLGRYVLGRCVGVGGMGAVYEATDPQLERRVAIKVLRETGGGTEATERHARFERERLILASLEHPHIARLLDGGTTPEGRSYLVLEFIEGTPIDVYCRDRKLDVPARLALFAQVCRAVHFAHHQLVVHRDLKPSNILVTKTGSPRVVDFGIARLLEDERSPTTASGFQPMTPEYASPEQISHELPATSTDVYSLGVVLYEVLTGALPYQLQSKRMDELVRAVKEQEPRRPSDVVTDVRLRRALRGEVDAVVGMALRKSARDRYGSAEQFADDLRNVLESRPTRARRGSWAYRVRLFLKRNTAVVAAAVAALFALSAGAASTVWQRGVAQEVRERAALEALEAARLAADAEQMQESMRIQWLLPPHDLRPAYELIRRAVAELQGQPPSVAQGEAAFTLGRGLQLLGDDASALEELTRAWEKGFHRPEVARALSFSEGRVVERDIALLGRVDDPERRKALIAKLTEKYRSQATARLALVQGATWSETLLLNARLAALDQRWTDALADAKKALAAGADPLETNEFIAEVQVLRTREAFEQNAPEMRAVLTQALASAQTAVDIGRSSPRALVLLIRLRTLEYDLDSNTKGLRHDALDALFALVKQAEQLDADSSDLLIVWSDLEKRRGDALAADGDASALAVYESGLAHAERSLKLAQFDQRAALLQVANACHTLGLYLATQGADVLAVSARGIEAANLAEQLAPGTSGPVFNRAQLSAFRAYAVSLKGIDARAEAANAVRDARQFVALGDRPVPARVVLADALSTLAEARFAVGESGDAAYAESLSVLREAEALAPQNWAVQVKGVELASWWVSQALQSDRVPDGALEQGQHWAESLAPLLPKNGVWASQVGSFRVTQARVELSKGRDPTPFLALAVPLLLPLADAQSATVDELANAELVRAEWTKRQNRDATAMVAKALSLSRRAQKLDPSDLEAQLLEARALLAMKEPDKRRALELINRVLAASPNSPSAKRLQQQAQP